VKRAFHMLDELGDIVQGKPRFEITEITGPHLKGLPLSSGPPVFQPTAQRLVDDLAERPAGALRFRLELGCHIVVEGQCRAHVLKLWLRHHDVKSR
jgi:hypothetical protein